MKHLKNDDPRCCSFCRSTVTRNFSSAAESDAFRGDMLPTGKKVNWKKSWTTIILLVLLTINLSLSHVASWAMLDVSSEHERFESLLRVMPRQRTIAVILAEIKLRVVA